MQVFLSLKKIKMKIICVGMNYSEHIREMGNTFPNEPILFLKPETALLTKNKPFFLPDFSQNVQYELEVLVKINKVGKCISERFAHTYYDEIGLGIDFTARDIQKQCIAEGKPWDIAKGFDNSAVVSNFINKNQFDDVQKLQFYLEKNGQKVQNGNTSDMIFNINRLISIISNYYTLKIGDIIFTGTPFGVGEVKIGDHLQGYLESYKMMDFYVK